MLSLTRGLRHPSTIFIAHPLRRQSTYQAPTPPQPKQPNPHGNFYKTFGRPVAKNFLIGMFTFQILYWSWLKLESMEIIREKEGEMRGLEGEIRRLTTSKSNP